MWIFKIFHIHKNSHYSQDFNNRDSSIYMWCIPYSLIFILILSMHTACGSQHSRTRLIQQFTTQQKHELQQADIILLGETHDHPTHHKLQASLIKWLQPKSVAFEMLNHDQSERVSKISAQPFKQWESYLRWKKSGWPKYSLYQPIFKQIHTLNIPIIAAHPDRKTIHPLKLGQSLDPSLIKALALDQPLPTQGQKQLEKEITIAHCGYAPATLLKAMVQAQRLKDAWMARALIHAPKPVVMIVGRGHTALNRGIPWAIRTLSDQKWKVKVVDFTLNHTNSKDLNATHVHKKIKELNKDEPKSERSATIKVDTVAHHKDDPCERFKKKLEKMRKAHHNHSKGHHKHGKGHHKHGKGHHKHEKGHHKHEKGHHKHD